MLYQISSIMGVRFPNISGIKHGIFFIKQFYLVKGAQLRCAVSIAFNNGGDAVGLAG